MRAAARSGCTRRAPCPKLQSSGTAPAGGAPRAAASRSTSGRVRLRRSLRRAAHTRIRPCKPPAPGAARLAERDTSSPAMFCSSMATCSRTWPSHVPCSSRMRRNKPARHLIRASVLLKAGQCGRQCVDERRPRVFRSATFERARVEQRLDHREVSVQRRTHIDVAIEDSHGRPCLILTFRMNERRRRPAAECAG